MNTLSILYKEDPVKEKYMSEQQKRFTFINSFYIRERWGNINGQYTRMHPDAMLVVYKIDDIQYIKIIPDPEFSFHVAKANVHITHYIDNIKKTDADEITIKYHDLERVLADFAGKSDEYFDIKRNAHHYANFEERRIHQRQFYDSLHKNPRVFGSDVNINDYYKQQFVKQHGVNVGNYKLMFYDIETDGFSKPEDAKAPINCMSFYNQPTDTMYTYIWDQPNRWPSFQKFKNEVQSGAFLQRLKDDPEMNGQYELNIANNPETDSKTKKAMTDRAKFNNNNTKYVIEFFEKESDMIRKRYEMIHTLDPDFCFAWNFSFDELTTINRLKQLLEHERSPDRVEDIICDPEIPPEFRQWFFKEDINPQHEYYNKWHYLSIPGVTQYLCSMSMYANMRKGSGASMSYGLNDICIAELQKGKLDYHGVAADPLELPYKDFAMHVHYNIKDVWCMAHLEYKNHDIDVLMYLIELTQLPNAAKKTAIVKNKMQQFYESQGLVMANNRNALVMNPATNYEGAMVAEPSFNEEIITPLFPYPSKTIRPFVADSDLASLYPSLAISSNIYKTTLLFKVDDVGMVSEKRKDIPSIDIEECMDNFQTGDIFSWGRDYLQLPSIGTLVTELDIELQALGKREVSL